MESNTPQGFILTREHKILLLRWLKNGCIDKMEFMGLSNELDKSMTIEEVKEELDRLMEGYGGWYCSRMRELKQCDYCNGVPLYDGRYGD